MNIVFEEADRSTSFSNLGNDFLRCLARPLDVSNGEMTMRKTFVAKSELGLIGVASCEPWYGAFPPVVKEEVFSVGIVSVVFVIPAFRGETIGRTLLKHCEKYLHSIGCKQIILSAKSQNGLQFFEKCGFGAANVLTITLDDTLVLPGPIINTIDDFIYFKAKGSECDDIVALHWKLMWMDVGIPESCFKEGLEEITLDFIASARESLAYQTFVAIHSHQGQEIICGSISCQLVNKSSAQMLLCDDKVGTVWAVYVHPAYRCRGVARSLMTYVLRHWRDIGCNEGTLMYASQNGRRVYERLGFAPNLSLSCVVTESCTTPPSSLTLPFETSWWADTRLLPPMTSPAQDNLDAASSSSTALSESSSCDSSTRSNGIFPLACPEALSAKGIARLRERPSLDEYTDVYLRQLIFGLYRQLTVLSELHERDSDVGEAIRFRLPDCEDVCFVMQIQRELGVFINPHDNWLTQNVKKFGRGFDMKELCQDPAQLASKFNRLSDKYDEWAAGNKSKVDGWIAKQAIHFYSRYGGQGTQVLDAACGIGLPSQTTRLCGWKGHFTCSDISPGMLQRALQRGACDKLLVLDLNSGMNALASDSYNLVICTGVLELLNHGVVLPEFYRVLAPGGLLWASFQIEDATSDMPSPTAHQNVHGIPTEDATRRLVACGFKIHKDRCEQCMDAFYTPSSAQDGSMLPVPYFFVVAEKV